MRSKLALLAVIAFPLAAAAQEFPALSGRISALAGVPYGLKAGVQLSLSADHEVGASYVFAARGSTSLPEGYGQSGPTFSDPLNKLNAACLTYAYTAARFGTGKRAALRLEAGLIAGELRSAFNFRRDLNHPGPDFVYTADLRRTLFMGVMISPEVSYRFNRILGGDIGPYAVLGKDFSGGGLSISFTLGGDKKPGANLPAPVYSAMPQYVV